MKGMKYQLKSTGRDKICILSFFLPVIAGLAISLFSNADFSTYSETAFCIVKNSLSEDTTAWLSAYGTITEFEDVSSLKNAIKDPSTQAIGVLQSPTGIRTLLSGDELQLYTEIGNTLPLLYSKRQQAALSPVTILPAEKNGDSLIFLLIAITMVTALFMGCTFNAMSIIGEKEDGIAQINQVLPMTKLEYVLQKITLGFAGSILSAALTACTCIRLPQGQLMPFFLLLLLSAFLAALAGLYIGRFSNGLMAGILSIKTVMILFLAPPVLFYLAIPQDSLLFALSCLIPSSGAFYGLMDLMSGRTERMGAFLMVLSVHCLVWLLLFLAIVQGKGKKSEPEHKN